MRSWGRGAVGDDPRTGCVSAPSPSPPAVVAVGGSVLVAAGMLVERGFWDAAAERLGVTMRGTDRPQPAIEMIATISAAANR